jgi:transposase InsO family protein
MYSRCAENDIQLEVTAPNTPQMNGVVERSFATCKDCAFATMYCARFSLATQGLLWHEAVNTITKMWNRIFTLVNFVGHTNFLRESLVRSVLANSDNDDAVRPDFQQWS